MRKSDPEKVTFEKLYAELEGVVSKLEGGNLTLDESLELFQQGMEMAKRCSEMLDQAELRVKELTPSPGGEPSLIDFEMPED